MLDEAVKEFDIDRAHSYMIGDNISDIKAGINAGVKPVLVTTGHGMEHIDEVKEMGVDVFNSIYDFALALSDKKIV